MLGNISTFKSTLLSVAGEFAVTFPMWNVAIYTTEPKE
jgi:hypothetical protein